jgi:hypothetical protein
MVKKFTNFPRWTKEWVWTCQCLDELLGSILITVPVALHEIVVNYLHATWVPYEYIFADSQQQVWVPNLPVSEYNDSDPDEILKSMKLNWSRLRPYLEGGGRRLEWKRHLLINGNERKDLLQILFVP